MFKREICNSFKHGFCRAYLDIYAGDHSSLEPDRQVLTLEKFIDRRWLYQDIFQLNIPRDQANIDLVFFKAVKILFQCVFEQRVHFSS